MVMADTRIVEIENLTKQFDAHVVLKNISLNVQRGENLVVFGRSGQGKSVLLKCLIGLMPPDEGTIKINDENIFEMSLGKISASFFRAVRFTIL